MTHSGDVIGLTEIQGEDIVSLSRTRKVERHPAFELYCLLYCTNVAVIESIFKLNSMECLLVRYALIC